MIWPTSPGFRRLSAVRRGAEARGVSLPIGDAQMSNMRSFWVGITVLGVLAAPGLAQTTTDWPQGRLMSYVLDSGDNAA